MALTVYLDYSDVRSKLISFEVRNVIPEVWTSYNGWDKKMHFLNSSFPMCLADKGNY